MQQPELALPPVIAHRGASASAPENTLSACRLALEQGATWMEVDVNISSDGTLFLHHDDGLNRCTDGSGYLVGETAQALRQLDAGSWFSSAFAGEPLALLDELVELLAANNAGLNLEVKPTPGWEYPLVEALSRVVREKWPENVPLLISSFSPLALEELRRQLPHACLGLLVSAIPRDWPAWMERFDCNTFHCAAPFVTAELCAEARERKIPVLCYTVNDVDRAHELFSLGVTSIFSDEAEKMVREFGTRAS